MYSPARNADKKFLLELVELIELLVKINTPESLHVAEKFGETYLRYEKRIKEYDYSHEDKIYELLCLD